MNYSRVLQVEYEQPINEDGGGAYTVFNLIQPFKLDLRKSSKICIQTFAVLWNTQPDTRVIALIEKALIRGVLSPVKPLQTTEGILNIVYNCRFNLTEHPQFKEAWEDIAGCAFYDDWTAELFDENLVHSTISGGQIFRAYALEILSSHELGVRAFTEEMFFTMLNGHLKILTFFRQRITKGESLMDISKTFTTTPNRFHHEISQ